MRSVYKSWLEFILVPSAMLAEHKTRVSELLALAKDKKQAAEALGELAQLASKAELESVLVAALPQVIEAIGDKQKTTQAAATQVRPGAGPGQGSRTRGGGEGRIDRAGRFPGSGSLAKGAGRGLRIGVELEEGRSSTGRPGGGQEAGVRVFGSKGRRRCGF